ncbi:MAG: coenzyme F420-0:L-glutamate ligase [bacterium]
MDIKNIKPNQNKKLIIEIAGEYFYRYPIKTHLIGKDDNLLAIAKKYLKDIVRHDDLAVFSKKIVSITQKRAYLPEEITPTRLAKVFSKFVKKSPKIGTVLGTPEAMQLAIDESGRFRIVLAAVLSALTKPFRLKGIFYRVAGQKALSVSGPANYTISPYNNYYFKCPADPKITAQELSRLLGCQTVIIDACDMGVDVLGASDEISKEIIKKIFQDNPLGQSNEQTPIAVIRRERPGKNL